MRYRRKNLRENKPGGTRSERLLQRSFESIRNEQSPATDLSVVRASVLAREVRRTGKETTSMARISSNLRRHPALSISFATVLALVLFTILIPLPYSSVVGYQAVISGPENGAQVPIASIDRALATLGYDQASVSFNTEGNSTSFTIDGLPSKEAAREAAAVFSTIAGYKGSIDYRPVVKRVSGTLLAQVQDKYFRVEVDASGKTDAEIAAEIASKLEAQGLGAPQVTVTTGADGSKQLSIEATADAESGGDSQTIEIQMTDGQN